MTLVLIKSPQADLGVLDAFMLEFSHIALRDDLLTVYATKVSWVSKHGPILRRAWECLQRFLSFVRDFRPYAFSSSEIEIY